MGRSATAASVSYTMAFSRMVGPTTWYPLPVRAPNKCWKCSYSTTTVSFTCEEGVVMLHISFCLLRLVFSPRPLSSLFQYKHLTSQHSHKNQCGNHKLITATYLRFSCNLFPTNHYITTITAYVNPKKNNSSRHFGESISARGYTKSTIHVTVDQRMSNTSPM